MSYRGFEEELLVPLWTEIGDLMPLHPKSKAVPHVWRWQNLLRLADRAGHIVPVGRGGERRAIALANPALAKPYATPTLWAAIQYLMPARTRLSTGTPRTHFDSSSRATASGRLSSATQCR